MKQIDVRTLVLKDRQRQEKPSFHISDLANSFTEIGILHPIVITEHKVLCAGECRTKAIFQLGELGIGVTHEGEQLPPYYVPFTYLSDAEDEIILAKAELAENDVRHDLTWQEKDAALVKIADLLGLVHGKEATTEEVATKAFQEKPTAYQKGKVKDALHRNRFAHLPEVVKAKSSKDADKIIAKKIAAGKRQELAEKHVETKSPHTLIKGDCTVEIKKFKDESFDIILSDPIYGINMHEANAFQRIKYQEGQRHDYDDSPENFNFMFEIMPEELYRVAAKEAHLYLFCDITRFFDFWATKPGNKKPSRVKGLSTRFAEAGWSVWPRPLVWYKGNIGSLPRPEHGPRYTCEYILFAIKGEKKTTGVYHDCISIPQTTGQIHPAGKPAAVYSNLLRRSATPGDNVLDFNAGCCPIFPAANANHCIATAIELEEKYYKEGLLRMEETINE